MRTLVRNIGTLVSGRLGEAPQHDTSLLIEAGRIVAVGQDGAADQVIDAAGGTVAPGLIDGHSHPSMGDFTPTQNSLGWPRAYLHGGVTTLISAGELHVPGLPLGNPDPEVFLALSRLGRTTLENMDLGGGRMLAGTVLLVPGMTRAHFEALAAIGVRGAKFIFYDWDKGEPGEAERYVRDLHDLGLWVKLHSGGVSRSGVSRVAGADIVMGVLPDVVAHIAGGPIPMPLEDMQRIVRETSCFVELATSGNPRMTLETLRAAEAEGALDRVTVGTDTPGGTGVAPRAMMRNILFFSSVGGLKPEDAIALATGNTGRAHRTDYGVIAPGRPADLIFMDRIQGSVGVDALDAIHVGDLPGISLVMVEGRVVVEPRSEQTPPPVRVARVVSGRE